LHVSVEFFQGLSQVVDLENGERLSLDRAGDFRTASEEKRPVRSGGKNCVMRDIVQQPGSPSLTDSGSQAGSDGLPGMKVVFQFECSLERLYEFVAGMADFLLQEEYLR
jgi:hypothetical protein